MMYAKLIYMISALSLWLYQKNIYVLNNNKNEAAVGKSYSKSFTNKTEQFINFMILRSKSIYSINYI